MRNMRKAAAVLLATGMAIEDPHPINDRKPLVGVWIFSVRLIDDQKDAAWPQSSVHPVSYTHLANSYDLKVSFLYEKISGCAANTQDLSNVL